MIRTFIVWSCVAASAMASAQAAHAYMLTEESGEYVVVTGVSGIYVPQPDERDAPFFPEFWQFVIIDGVPTIVLTNIPYSPGRQRLYLEETWNGYNVYGVGDCIC